jgi:hypothetical protein
MRRHTRSGATILVALSLVAIGCGREGSQRPISGSSGAGSQIALTRRADTVAVDESVRSARSFPGSGHRDAVRRGAAPIPTSPSSRRTVLLFALKSGARRSPLRRAATAMRRL